MGYYPAKICALLNIVILVGKIHFFSRIDFVANHVECPVRYFKYGARFLGHQLRRPIDGSMMD